MAPSAGASSSGGWGLTGRRPALRMRRCVTAWLSQATEHHVAPLDYAPLLSGSQPASPSPAASVPHSWLNSLDIVRARCRSHAFATQSALERSTVERSEPSQAERSLPACEDDLEACADWGDEGECERNPDFMRARCRLACLVRTTTAFSLRLNLLALPRLT